MVPQDVAKQKQAMAAKKPLDLHPPAPSATPSTTSNLSHATVQRALVTPRTLLPNDILQLHRTIGNRAVSHLLAPQEKGESQQDAPIGAQGGEVDGTLSDEIQRAKSGGSAIPNQIASEIEGRTGLKTDNVRVHVGNMADTLNRQLDAEAFTHGRDLFFRNGAYRPGTATGNKLLAHELTHVAQQTATNPQPVQAKMRVGPAADRYEREADRVADGLASSRGGTVSQFQPTSRAMAGPTVQRKMKFKSTDLQGDLSTNAKRSSKFGIISTFRKLQILLAKYESQQVDLDLQRNLLTNMMKLSQKYLAEHGKSHAKTKGKSDTKGKSVAKLQTAIGTEFGKLNDKIKGRDFIENIKGKTEIGLKLPMYADPHALGKQVSHNRSHNITPPDDPYIDPKEQIKANTGWGQELLMYTKDRKGGEQDYQEYKAQKHLGLTPAERIVLQLYTGDTYVHMNPAVTGNKQWFEKSVRQYYKGWGDKRPGDDAVLQELMEAYQEIGKMTISALNKLPTWKHKGTIYRGETISDKMAAAMKVGFVKRYDHFVSTSLERSRPMGQIGAPKTAERPWGVLYNIISSKTGKDVEPFTRAHGELEILFAPGTNFAVTQILKRDSVNKMLEVEVIQR